MTILSFDLSLCVLIPIVLEKKSNLSSIREYCQRGCPTSLRGKLWSAMLEIDLTSWVRRRLSSSLFFPKRDRCLLIPFEHVTYFNYLKQNVIDYDLLVDSLYFKV